MSLYVLDTDILTLYQCQHPVVLRHLFGHLQNDLAVTVSLPDGIVFSARPKIIKNLRAPTFGWQMLSKIWLAFRFSHFRNPQLTATNFGKN
jgi:hypothetical protein